MRKTKPLIILARYDKTLITRRSKGRKVQWDFRNRSEPSRATKLERQRRYLRENQVLEAR